jgi:hypothetical protein
MAEIVVPGPISGRNYGIKIKGATPSVDEQQRIDSYIGQQESNFSKEYEQKYGVATNTEGTGVLNYLGEIPKGVARGGIGMLESGLLGAATLLPEQYETPTREAIRRGAYSLKPQADVGLEDTVGGQFGEALGSFAGLGLVSLLPGGQFAAPALAVGAGAGEASERARAAGATEAERSRAAMFGAPVGLAELLPIKFISVLGKPATGTIMNRLARASAEGGVEGAQEAATQIAQNLIAQGIYDPEQGTFSGTGEALGYGAGVGGLVQAVLDLLPGRSRTPAVVPPTTPSVQGPTLAPGQQQGELFSDLLTQPTPTPTAPVSTRPQQLELPLPSTEQQLALDLSVAPMGAQGDLFAPEGSPRIFAPTQNPQLLTALGAIETTGEATVKTIQDALDIGYSPAVQVMGELEKLGAVSKPVKGKRTLVVKSTVELPTAAAPVVAAPVVVPKPKKAAAPVLTTPMAVAAEVTPKLADKPLTDPKVQEALSQKVTDLKAPKKARAVASAILSQPITSPEPADVATPAETQPEAVGGGTDGGAQGVGESGRPADTTQAAPGAEAPAGVGLGRDLPVPVDTAVPEGKQPAALTRPTTGAPRLTGRATELQLRDAERALAPVREVNEIAANAAAQTELDAAWAKRFSKKPELAALSEEYATPDAAVAEDPTTAADKRKILELSKPGAIKSGKAGQAGAANARTYFSKFKRPIDALDFIVADATLKNLRFKNEAALEAEGGTLPAGDEAITPQEREFFSGMSRERAKLALAWATENLSEQANVKIRDLERKYAKAQEAKVPTRASSSLLSSTSIGGRTASLDERQALEQELQVQATEQIAKNSVDRTLVSLGGGRGLSAILTEVEARRGVPKSKIVPIRKVGDIAQLTPKAQDELLFETIMGLKFRQNEDVLDLDTQLHPSAVRQLERGNLQMALRATQLNAPNARIRAIASKLAKLSSGIKVVVTDNLQMADGESALGAYDPKTKTMYLDRDAGLTIETLMHEMVHVATIAELSRPSSPITMQLTKLFEETRPLLDSSYGATNLEEFVAEALSNPRFQAKLALLHPKGRQFSSFERFVSAVTNMVRRLLSMQAKPINSALDVTDQLIYQMLQAAPDDPGAGMLYRAANPQVSSQILNGVARVSGAFPPRTKEFAQEFGDSTSSLMATVGSSGKRIVLGLMNMQAVADVAVSQGIKGAHELESAMRMMDSAAIKSDQDVDSVLLVMQKWLQKNLARKETFDRVVTTSTTNQVDPSFKRENAIKKYGAGSEKMATYDAMQKDWAALGPEGRALYNLMRQTYKKQYERLRAALLGKIDFVLGGNPAVAAQVKANIQTKFLDMNKIEPYFPLARVGDYWLEYSAFDPETNTTEPVKEVFESPRARDRALAELASVPGVTKGADGKPIANMYNSLDIITRGRNPDSMFVRDTLAIIKTNLTGTGVSQDVSDSIQQEFTRMFVEALPETSFAKSMQRRKNTRGFIEDSFQSFKLKAYSLGRQGVRYAYSNEVRRISDEILAQGERTADQNRIAMIQELVARAEFAVNPPNSTFERAVQTANRAAFAFTIGFNVSSALVNLSSIPIVVMPYLGGRYGYGATSSAITNAYKLFLNSGFKRELELPTEYMGSSRVETKTMPSIDNYFVLNNAGEYVLRDDTPAEMRATLEELAPLVDMASKQGQLNRSVYYDSIGVESVGRSRSITDKLSAMSGAMFHQVERSNRQVALVAAYTLELQRLRNKPTAAEQGMSEAQRRTRAAERAIYQTTETNGGATLASAPRLSQQGIMRAALMFKNYGLSMFYLQMKLAKQITVGSSDPDFTPEMRMAAFKQLMGIQLSALALAGISGVPLFGAATMIANAFLGDDEEDAEMIARRYLGEGIYKGMLTEATGLDISSRIGLTGLLIRENRYNTNPSMEKDIVAALGGPAWSTFTQVNNGVGEIFRAMTGGEGDMVRGIENMTPAAVRNFVKAGRYMFEGSAIDTRRGDVITGDLGANDLIGQAFGFKPAEASLQQDLNQLKVKISKKVSEKRSSLSREYYIAMRAGDIEGMQEIREKIAAFNEEMRSKYPQAIIDNKFLENSLKSHQRTSETMDNGISTNPIVRDALRELGGQYNQGFQLF